MNFYLYLIVYSLFPIIDLKKMNGTYVVVCIVTTAAEEMKINSAEDRNNEKSAIFLLVY